MPIMLAIRLAFLFKSFMPSGIVTARAVLALTIALLPGLVQLPAQNDFVSAKISLPAQAQEKATFKLSGGISHSDSLEPLPLSERVGVVQGGNSSAITPLSTPPTTPALVNPYRNSGGTPSAVQSGADAARVQPQPAQTQPPQNPIYYSRTPHLDPGPALYKKRLRELAEQNLLATAVKRPGKLQIKVPFWLAGQWQRTETNELSRKELPSGKALKAVGKQVARVTDVFGTYKDRRGNVFMIVPLGASGAVDRGFAVDYHRVKKYEMILDGNNSAVIKVQASHQVVSKKDKRVVEAYQDEELNRYTLINDGLVKNDSSVKVFDQLGQPKLITRAVSTERRVKRI